MYGLPDNAVVGFGKRAKGMAKRAGRGRAMDKGVYKEQGDAIVRGIEGELPWLNKFNFVFYSLFGTKKMKAQMRKIMEKQEKQG